MGKVVGIFVVVVLVVLTSGCGKIPDKNNTENIPPVDENNIKPEQNGLVGGDRDEHGCIGSAGYQWCPSKGKCLRIWEEACEE